MFLWQFTITIVQQVIESASQQSQHKLSEFFLVTTKSRIYRTKTPELTFVGETTIWNKPQKKISRNMVSAWRQVLLLVTVFALITSTVNANNSRPPRNNDISNMADAMKYLQDLDTYYGDRARVRFGKRMPLIQMLRNHFTNDGEMMAHPLDMSNVEEPF